MNRNKSEETIEREIPRILYHGTTDEYLKMCIQFASKYSTNAYGVTGPVYITDSVLISVNHALARAKQFHCLPILFIIDSDKLDNIIGGPNNNEIKNINWDSFLIYAPLKNNDLINTNLEIEDLGERLIKLNTKKVTSEPNYALNWNKLF
jgi:hypothetical protein